MAEKYQIKTLSRDPSKPAAKALADAGMEVIKGDIGDASSAHAILQGADFVFLVTQFWEALDKEKEYNEGKVFLDAVKASNVKRLVFSTLEDVTAVTEGKITGVHHFDGKGKLMAYAKSLNLPAVYVKLACYFENMMSFFVPRPNAEGKLAVTLPDMQGKPFNNVSVAETGMYVKAIDADWDKWVGKEIPLCSELITLDDMLKKMSDVLGVEVVYNPVPAEVFASFGFPGADDLAQMFVYYREGPIDRDPKISLELYPEAATTESWTRKNKDTILKAWGIQK